MFTIKIMEQFIYRIKKLIFILSKLYKNTLVSIFYSLNKNKDIEEIININRQYLSEIENFLPEDAYKNNDYGIQKRIYKELDKEIVKYPTYSDLMIYIMKLIHGSQNINYLEIGVSVLKNYLQINNAINNSHIHAYDINPINPNFSDLELISRNNNKLSYFQGSVLTPEDGQNFKLEANKDFDFIFSDALHTPEGIRSEYKLIIKESLGEEFIVYYDDLDFPGIENEVYSICEDLESNINKKVYFYSFSIYGWIGNHEKTHKNGILTTYNLEQLFKENKFKLLNFRVLK
jgi:hypothetical protein